MAYKLNDILDFILDLECKYNLINIKINNIYFWKIIRFNIFLEITKGIGLYGEPHPNSSKKGSFKEKLKKEFFILKNNALKGKYTKEILVFQHPRKTNVSGKKIDIYTDYFVSQQKVKNYEMLDLRFVDVEYHQQNDYKIARMPFLEKIKVLKEIKFNSEELVLLDNIRNEINQAYDLSIDVLNITKGLLRTFKTQFSYFNKLLINRKPHKVYIVCSYGLEALVASAKKNNIEVIEIQHGVISKYHVGYSFPNNNWVPYFPDRIILFGEFWSDSTSLPLPCSNIEHYGYPYLETQIKRYKNIEKKKNQVIFISQGTITEKLSQIAYEFANNNKEYNIVYKLHPSEIDIWKDKYHYLLKADKFLNFDIVDNKRNLYEFLAESEYQVGVYSTAIYEGIAMGAKSILINLPGIEYMDFLIEKGIALKVNNATELSYCLKREFFTPKKNYFFKDILLVE